MKLSKIFFFLAFILTGTFATAQNVQQQALQDAGLTETEMTEVKAIDAKFKTDAKAVRQNTELDRKAKGKELRALQQNRKAELVSTMGEEKYARYQELVAEKRKSAKNQKDAAMAELNLSADQETTIQEINKKFRKAGQELKTDKTVSMEDKKLRAKELRKEQMAELKAVLNDEQYQQYMEMKKQKKSRK